MFSSIQKLAVCGFVASAIAFAACAENVDLGSQPRDDDDQAFVPVDDGGAVIDTGTPPSQLLCMGTECPFPYTTCLDEPSFLCGTNLMNDPANCGGCGQSCMGFDPLSMKSSCVQGKCEFECLIVQNMFGGAQVYKNCNAILDDGCEVDINSDEKNCGACGNACKDGVSCIDGRCGCPNGLVECNGECKNLAFDDYSCGACNNGCDPSGPADACETPPQNTYYGCGNSTCDVLKCSGKFGDCDRDLFKGCASNGCETPLEHNTENCGFCGNKCGTGQECRDDGDGFQCYDTCEKAGLTACEQGCKDLLTDRFNCGACGNFCPNPRANQESSCHKGLCELECQPGWADCNGDPNDGCEVNTDSHPGNCGSCGNQCNFGAGQPCIDGKCLMTDCDAGVTR